MILLCLHRPFRLLSIDPQIGQLPLHVLRLAHILLGTQRLHHVGPLQNPCRQVQNLAHIADGVTVRNRTRGIDSCSALPYGIASTMSVHVWCDAYHLLYINTRVSW